MLFVYLLINLSSKKDHRKQIKHKFNISRLQVQIDTNEFLLLWLGFNRLVNVAMSHRNEKCDLFIYLLIYRAQRKHKMNIIEI